MALRVSLQKEQKRVAEWEANPVVFEIGYGRDDAHADASPFFGACRTNDDSLFGLLQLTRGSSMLLVIVIDELLEAPVCCW